MPVLLGVNVVGLEEVEAFIDRIGNISRIYWPNKVMDDVANHWKDKLKEMMPEGETGDMRAGVWVESGPDTRTIHMDAPYTNIVDKGSPAHPISIRNKEALAFLTETGEYVVVSRIPRHPGFRGKHFIRRSKLKAIEFARKTFKSTIEGDVEREVLATRGRWW